MPPKTFCDAPETEKVNFNLLEKLLLLGDNECESKRDYQWEHEMAFLNPLTCLTWYMGYSTETEKFNECESERDYTWDGIFEPSSLKVLALVQVGSTLYEVAFFHPLALKVVSLVHAISKDIFSKSNTSSILLLFFWSKCNHLQLKLWHLRIWEYTP